MNRRELLTKATLAGSGIAMAAAATSKVLAADHQHGGHGHANSPYAALIAALNECKLAGEACLAHCLDHVVKDPSFAECIRTTRECITLSDAMIQLAYANSPQLKALSVACIGSCEACMASCRDHTDPSCVACYKACERCLELCRAL